jgi:hypothetical protein
MNNESYIVVGLDGKEHNNVQFETIKEWYLNRKLNGMSLVFSPQIGQWKMLKRVFDLNDFEPDTNYRTPPQVSNSPQTQVTQNYSQTPYNQNNQPLQNGTMYNPSAPTQFQPPVYRQPNQGYAPPNNYARPSTYAANAVNNFVELPRQGFKLAAIILSTNSVLWGISLFVILFFRASVSDSSADKAFQQMGGDVAKGFIKLAIDLYIAKGLWNAVDEANKTRIWAIIRTYVGSILGLAVVGLFLAAKEPVGAVVTFGAIFFYALGLLVVLHGKESPSSGRVKLGWFSFILFVVFSFGSMSYSSALVSSSAGLNSNSEEGKKMLSDVTKYEIAGKEFVDPATQAKVVLPNGWRMLSVQNPFMTTQYARMVATDALANKGAMLEIVNFPEAIDKNAFLDKMVGITEDLLRKNSVTYRTVSASSIPFGNSIAKKIVFERIKKADSTDKIKNSQEVFRGHIIIAADAHNAYILQMWSPKDEYDAAIPEFGMLERSFVVPNAK